VKENEVNDQQIQVVEVLPRMLRSSILQKADNEEIPLLQYDVEKKYDLILLDAPPLSEAIIPDKFYIFPFVDIDSSAPPTDICQYCLLGSSTNIITGIISEADIQNIELIAELRQAILERNISALSNNLKKLIIASPEKQYNFSNAKYNKILKDLNFSIPIMLIGLDAPIRNLVAGRLLASLKNSADVLSAYNIIFTGELFVVIPLITPIFLSGEIFARTVNTGDPSHIRNKYHSLRQVDGSMTILPALIMPLLLPQIFKLMNVPPESITMAQRYFIARSATLLFENMMFSQRIISYVFNGQWTSITLMSMGLGVYTLSGYMLVNNKTGLDCTGLAISAAATAIFQWVAHEIYIGNKFKNILAPFLYFKKNEFKETAKELLRMSWPIIWRNAFYQAAYFSKTTLLNRSGDNALVINLISSTYTFFLFSVGNSYNQINIVKASRFYSENNFPAIPTSLKSSFVVLSTINLSWLILAAALPTAWLASIITDDPELLDAIDGDLKNFLILSSISQYIESLAGCISGILAGLQDTKIPALADISSFILSTILAFGLSSYTDLDILGVPMGFILGNIISCLCLGSRYLNDYSDKFSSSSTGSLQVADYTVPRPAPLAISEVVNTRVQSDTGYRRLK